MKRNLVLLVLFFAALALSACERVEVIAIEECSKVVGVKYYAHKIFWLTSPAYAYYVLEDGRELQETHRLMLAYENEIPYCETAYREMSEPDLNLEKRPPA